jgi:hypothetical protein
MTLIFAGWQLVSLRMFTTFSAFEVSLSTVHMKAWMHECTYMWFLDMHHHVSMYACIIFDHDVYVTQSMHVCMIRMYPCIDVCVHLCVHHGACVCMIRVYA